MSYAVVGRSRVVSRREVKAPRGCFRVWTIFEVFCSCGWRGIADCWAFIDMKIAKLYPHGVAAWIRAETVSMLGAWLATQNCEKCGRSLKTDDVRGEVAAP